MAAIGETAVSSVTGESQVEESSVARTPHPAKILKFPVAGTSALDPYLQDEIEDPVLPALLEEARGPRMFKGKSIAQWAIDRRRAARELKQQWEEELAPRIGTAGFAVLANGFLETVKELMYLYSGIEYEEVFSGLLQLIRDSLVGENFMCLSEGQVVKPISSALTIAADSTQLSLEVFDDALQAFTDAGMQRSAEE